MEELKNKIKRAIIKLIKRVIRIIIAPFMGSFILIMLVAGFIYYLTVDDGTYKENDWESTGFGAAVYTSSMSIEPDGTIKTGKTAQEIWDELKKGNSRVSEYLSGPDKLAKIMNAEVVTRFPDTRENPDEEINWDEMDLLKDKVQGIIKFKRSETNGNISTMTYVDPETFQTYIDNYTKSGSEADRKNALRHFTLEVATSSSYVGGQAPVIEAGTTINIPAGLGSSHTYMGWQMITSTTSMQYKLRQQAGMNFDEEGFGRINGRYVIACTTTFGRVGDYIDFYQEDGTIISCIIGDIKSQNDKGCTKWGHDNGHTIVEFVVDKDTWYNRDHPNPGTKSCHPEWNKNLTKAVNGGSYFDNPNFGTDTVVGNGNNIDDTAGEKEMKWPTDGTKITSEYGYRERPTEGASTNHKGIDIGVPQGTNVYACEDGKVTIAMESETAGKYIAIDHGNGYLSKYMHNSELKVAVGDEVKKGQLIALSGNTGISSGPHLHFQIEYNGKPVDPLTFKYDNSVGNGTGGIGSNEEGIRATAIKYHAKIATWNKTTQTIQTDDPSEENINNETYSMGTTMINYQELVNKYTMQFDLLWALLVVGEDEDFILELADLAYNSDIEITVYDNYKKDTMIDEWTYIKEDKNKVSATVKENTYEIQKSTQFEDIIKTPYTTKTTVVTETNTVEIALTKANVWIVDYERTYKQGNTKTADLAHNEITHEPGEFPEEPNTTSDKYEHEKIDLLVQDVINEAKKKSEEDLNEINPDIKKEIKVETYSRRTDIKEETTQKEETKYYIAQTPKLIEKIDKKTEPNFVTIFNKKEYDKNKKNMRNATSWLIEILETNDSTKNSVDLIQFLLNKTRDEHKQKEDENKFDFSIFYPSELATIGGNYGGEGVQYYQDDYPNVPYGKGTISTSGCGPTCFAMVASQITGQKITPVDAIKWCGNKYYVWDIGTSWDYFQAAADHFNLGVKVTQTKDINSAVSALRNGKLVISSQAKGLFTASNHFILLYKVDKDEKIYVKDPNKRNANEKGYNNRAFTKTEINKAAKQYFIFE